MFDFPEKFDEESAAELRRIIQNGPRCGVLTLVIRNSSVPTGAYGPKLDGISTLSETFEAKAAGAWTDLNSVVPGDVQPVQSPAKEVVQALIKTIGEPAKESFKVEVPFDQMLELAKADGLGKMPWNESAAERIKLPLGRTGANKVQYLELGSGLSHHALVAGRPGSGKSNLLHVIIAGVAKLYSPTELQLYLVDFKKGVEFQPYADKLLPHARVIAVDSEREFGVSVLRALVREMNDRNDLFSRTGVQNLAKYREQNPESKDKPRILMLVDEFQEFFSPDDALAHEASLLLDQLVRMGRSAGVHLLLGSQTLAGLRAQASTLNLMTVRIALQCSEADSHLILAEGNSGARRLGRPGEGVYNSANGLAEGNFFFQVSLFEDKDRNGVLDEARELLAKRSLSADSESNFRPVVFKGHESAELSQCKPLNELLDGKVDARKHAAGWLGEPIAIADPIAAEFNREGGANLLVVNRDESEGLGVITSALLGLAANPAQAGSSFEIVALGSDEGEWPAVLEALGEALGDRCQIYGRKNIPQLLHRLGGQLDKRQEAGKPPAASVFLVILGLHRARMLRFDNDEETAEHGNPAVVLSRLLKFGSEVGMHVLTWVDGITGLERTFDSKLLREFGLRCAGPLDSRGSDILFDTDVATRLGERPHRMVMTDEKRIGVMHTFRPYSVPSAKWVADYGSRLRSRGMTPGG